MNVEVGTGKREGLNNVTVPLEDKAVVYECLCRIKGSTAADTRKCRCKLELCSERWIRWQRLSYPSSAANQTRIGRKGYKSDIRRRLAM